MNLRAGAVIAVGAAATCGEPRSDPGGDPLTDSGDALSDGRVPGDVFQFGDAGRADHEDDADAGDAACDGGCFTPCPGALTEKNDLMLDDMMRIFFVGFTEARVHFCNPLMSTAPENLVFFVELTNHKGIPASSLTAGTWVINDQNVRVEEGLMWYGTDLTIGEHHAGGTLTAPLTTADSTPVLGPDTTQLELHADYIGDQGIDAFFRWTAEFLP